MRAADLARSGLSERLDSHIVSRVSSCQTQPQFGALWPRCASMARLALLTQACLGELRHNQHMSALNECAHACSARTWSAWRQTTSTGNALLGNRRLQPADLQCVFSMRGLADKAHEAAVPHQAGAFLSLSQIRKASGLFDRPLASLRP